MTITVDSLDLDTLRDLINSGATDKAVGLIDQLRAMNPVNHDGASGRQLWTLHLITGRDTRGWTLTFAEATRMIEELNETGEATYDGRTFYRSLKAEKWAAKKHRASSIPF